MGDWFEKVGMGTLADRAAERFGSREALSYEAKRWTFADLRQDTDRAAKGLQLTTRSLPSGAGHDAQHMAGLCPSGMIFIPSVGGISHAPTEFSKPKDITNGANVLLHTVMSLDEQSWT